MDTSLFISPRVINTINSLPAADRVAVASAIAGELILGGKAKGELTPVQNLVFEIIRSYVKRDTARVVFDA